MRAFGFFDNLGTLKRSSTQFWHHRQIRNVAISQTMAAPPVDIVLLNSIVVLCWCASLWDLAPMTLQLLDCKSNDYMSNNGVMLRRSWLWCCFGCWQ